MTGRRRTPPGDPLRSLVLDRPWLVLAVLGLAGLLWWGVGTRSQDHHVRVAFDSAINLAPGMDVQAAGVDVGKVSEVTYEDGQAIVELGIEDGAAWPLHQGTTAAIRFGSTAGNGNRRIELEPGPTSAPEIPDGGVLGKNAVGTPVEVDEVLNTFRGPARKDLAALMQNGAEAVDDPTARSYNDGFGAADNAIRPVGAVFRDLADSDRALSRLIADGSRVTRVLADRRPQIQGLVEVTAKTFDVFARNSEDVQDTIAALPGTFQQARRTLARLEPTLQRTQSVLTDLRPGLRALPRLAASTTPALRELRPLSRDGAALADLAQDAAPPTTQLLRRLRPLSATATPVLDELDPIAQCIAPYAPELAGLFSSWSGYTQEYDSTTHYARARLMFGASVFQENPTGAEALTKLTPLDYNGFPAPGALSGMPQYLPKCGIDEAAADAANDWEKP